MVVDSGGSEWGALRLFTKDTKYIWTACLSFSIRFNRRVCRSLSLSVCPFRRCGVERVDMAAHRPNHLVALTMGLRGGGPTGQRNTADNTTLNSQAREKKGCAAGCQPATLSARVQELVQCTRAQRAQGAAWRKGPSHCTCTRMKQPAFLAHNRPASSGQPARCACSIPCNDQE